MARYIDADKLIEALRADYDREGANAYEMAKKGLADASVKYGHGQFCYLNAMERVKDTPTADVVPKSEVEVWKQNRFNLYQKLECYKMARQKVTREIFAEIDSLFERFYNDPSYSSGELGYDIAELKKKYTEDKG